MAISKNGGSNPIYILYNGKKVNEVLYNSVHVWPDGDPPQGYLYYWVERKTVSSTSIKVLHLSATQLNSNYVVATLYPNKPPQWVKDTCRINDDGTLDGEQIIQPYDQIIIDNKIKPTYMYCWFAYCGANGSWPQGLELIDTSVVPSFFRCFQDYGGGGTVGRVTVTGMENWDTSRCTNMSYMFCDCQGFNRPDLSNWNTSNVTDMSYMFSGAETDANMIGWDTSKVTTMYHMFYNPYPLNLSGSLWLRGTETWNVSNCLDFTEMFYNARIGYNMVRLNTWKKNPNATMSNMFTLSNPGSTEYDYLKWLYISDDFPASVSNRDAEEVITYPYTGTVSMTVANLLSGTTKVFLASIPDHTKRNEFADAKEVDFAVGTSTEVVEKSDLIIYQGTTPLFFSYREYYDKLGRDFFWNIVITENEVAVNAI